MVFLPFGVFYPRKRKEKGDRRGCGGGRRLTTVARPPSQRYFCYVGGSVLFLVCSD
ncbi:hypothetical protein HanXRQr2_Chr06g0272851 [Helianthus annuus]|uniref:Uncharacterized protein n=1 Tax=Helianthus annuus TaxID=4232 RepID=A0A9K3IV05_HELAN|nr:hypothetical protein HanXRQr2_Chr06g0272851 [Helianthus annuus]